MIRAVMTLAIISTAMAITCEEARMKCAFRTGCGNALQSYVLSCSDIMQETPPDECPEACQNALIALTSTDEGKDLMTCACDNDICNETKQRIEICRPQVMKAVKSDSIVTCDTAQWICAADAVCLKALEYYHAYCRSMFSGKRCSFRCKNSIAILKKQEKAAKLDTCRCSGKEAFDCPRIRMNMAKLCFNQTIEIEPPIVNVDVNDTKTTDGEKTVDVYNNVSDSANAFLAVRLPYLWAFIPLIANKCFYRYLLS